VIFGKQMLEETVYQFPQGISTKVQRGIDKHSSNGLVVGGILEIDVEFITLVICVMLIDD
jgi:hypothetical protein